MNDKPNYGNALIRDYTDSDYRACEQLVSKAWNFDENFSPQDLANLCKYIYTMGSVSESNFRRVVEINGVTVGFLFGFNENVPLPLHRLQRLPARLGIFRKLLLLRGIRIGEKLAFIKIHKNP